MVPAVAGALTLLVFLPSLRNGFVAFDDEMNFLRNQSYRGLGAANIRWMFTQFHGGHWQPLSWLTLGFDWVVSGMNPCGYHLTNVVLHALSAAVFAVLAAGLFVIGRKSGAPAGEPDARAVWFGGFVSLAWSLHPLRVEAVTWITERREVLCAFFCLLALTSAVLGKSRWLTTAFAVAAMLAKATGVTVPALLVLLDVFRDPSREGPGGFRRSVFAAVRRHAFLLAVAAAVTVAAVLAQREAKALVSYEALPFSNRIVLYFSGVFFCVQRTFWPEGLAPLHQGTIGSTWRLQPIVWWQAVGGLVLVCGALGAGWRIRRRGGGVLALVLSFLVMVAPASGLSQSGSQTAADRYTHQAAWALTLGIGFLAAARGRWPELWWKRLSTAAPSVLVLVLLAGGAIRQQGYWLDTETLVRRELQVYPDNGIANYRLGLLHLGKTPPDLAAAEAALRIAMTSTPGDPDVRAALADVLISTGRPADGLALVDAVLAQTPDHAQSLALDAKALASLGRKEEAVPRLEKLLAIDDQNPESWWLLGRAQAATGRPREGIATLEKGFERSPDRMIASDLAWLLATHPDASVRDGRRAVVLARAAMASGVDARTVVVLAAALAETGDFEQARREIEAAIPGTPTDQQAPMRDLMREMGKRQPVRAEPQFPLIGMSSGPKTAGLPR